MRISRPVSQDSQTSWRFLLLIIALALLVSSFHFPPSSDDELKGMSANGVEKNDLREILPETLRRAVQRVKGENWQAWYVGRDEIYQHDRGHPECRWAAYTCQYNSTQKLDVCLHPDKELISKEIVMRGHWGDCRAVSSQYHAEQRNESVIHLEAGANIGSCVWELLMASPHVHIVAFEPQGINLFRLTSTLKRAPLDLSKRVLVYPIALGKEGGGIVHLSPVQNDSHGNLNYGGNSISETGATESTEDVGIERLDSIVVHNNPIRFMKMDVQGFECNVLSGLLSSKRPSRIITEVDENLLQKAGCSREGLEALLLSHNYALYWYRNNGRLRPLPKPRIEFTMVAVLKSTALHQG